jgi:hypothetical protein
MRTGVAVLAASGVAVLAAGIGLKLLLGDAPASASKTSSAAPAKPEAAADPTPGAAPAGRPAATVPNAAPARPGAQPAMPSEPTPLRDDDEEPPPEIGSNGRPVPAAADLLLREEVALLNGKVSECLKGKTLTANALLLFEVRPRKGKTVVETMGFDEDKTDLQDQPLRECLEKTTELLKDRFPYVRGSGPILVRRSIKIDNGKLAENWVTWYSHLRR